MSSPFNPFPDLEELYDKIYRYCYFRVHQKELAEDLTQEVFLRCLSSKSYQEKGQTLQYLYTIARNLCIDEYRRHPTEPFTDGTETELHENDLSPSMEETLISSLPRARISSMKFLLIQAGYIPLWVWGLCCLPFPLLCLNAFLMAKSTLWVLSALMPFVAMTAVTENARSSLHHMAELEMASRFSLRSIVLARLGIIGIFHLLLLCLFTPLTCQKDGKTLLQSGVYLLVPYLLTTLLSLLCSRRIHGREALYACMGIAVMVSSLSIFLQERMPIFYQEEYLCWWIAALLLLILPVPWEYHRTIHQTEELIWN